MNWKNLFSGTGLVISMIISTGILTSCAPYVAADGYVYEDDDYVYYPEYGVYYGSRHNQYIYTDGSRWTRGNSPNVSVSVLASSQSVPMNFHDAPPHHHSEVLGKYPGHSHDHENGNGKDHGEDRSKGHD